MIDASITVERIISQRLGGCIFSGQLPPHGIVRVVAAADLLGAPPSPGEIWRVRGKIEDSRWGRQVRADALWRATPSGKLIGTWIINNVPGMGRARTERLMVTFGPRLVATLDAGDPEPLIPVLAPEHPNLGARLACSIIKLWNEQRISTDLHAWLDSHGVQQPHLARRLAELLGDDAIATLDANPYTLAGLLPWKQLDELGLRLLAGTVDQRFDPAKDARRLVGLVDAVMIERLTETGDTAIPGDKLTASIGRRLGETVSKAEVQRVVDDAIGLAVANRGIIPDRRDEGEPVYRAPGCWAMETMLVDRIADLVGGPWRSVIPQLLPDQRKRLVEAACASEGIRLHPEQENACTALLGLPLGILTGGAGVGKTTTTRALVAAWEAAGGRVELCALSGKAARRLGQSTHRLVKTIYRLIQDLRRRQDDATIPMIDTDVSYLDDRTLLVVDEASMVDLGQFTELLVDHLPLGCHVLLIGDPAQLPPIGPGLVFPILCQLRAFVAELTVVHRQTGTSGIPAISRSIREGTVPQFRPFDPQAPEGVSLLACDQQQMAREVHRVVAALGGHGTEGHDLLVLSPTNNGAPCSVHQMNRGFQAARMQAERFGEDAVLPGAFGQQFVVGDPVVYTRNLYREGLCNGMLGRVVGLDLAARQLSVLFDDGETREVGADQLADLQLAYALSCHKAQGSSARTVVVPIYRSRVLDRAWVYTAITRAEQACVLVGDPEVLATAITDLPHASRRLHGLRI